MSIAGEFFEVVQQIADERSGRSSKATETRPQVGEWHPNGPDNGLSSIVRDAIRDEVRAAVREVLRKG